MKTYITPEIKCCPQMICAQEKGTDSDGYMCAVTWDDEYRWRLFSEADQPGISPRGEYYVGNLSEQPIELCPWCGHEITEAEKRAAWKSETTQRKETT